MASNNNHPILLLVTVILLSGVAPWADAEMGCNVVVQSLFPCLSYFEGGGVGPVPGRCCTGIRNLKNQAKTTLDRQSVCKCLKDTANAARNINLGLAAAIPSRCGVNLPYKLDPSTDCSKIR